ncbi:hypothetical protein GCM10011511_17590 [Puia dinghuensis]|uniref:Uncharacterized protein n=1 Tax=Puia dinghuensis TaxID=1792502 RepID=A0A8J2UBN9_9BACT|nr:hypothetical protein GCM10011511_17590 [Puia dinghuensis]
MEAAEVFEKVEARAAVDRREIEGEMGLFLIAETDETGGHFFVVEKGEFFLPDRETAIETGVLVEAVIGAEPLVIEQLPYHPAALAAKGFVVHLYPVGYARFSAVGTEKGIFRRFFHCIGAK